MKVFREIVACIAASLVFPAVAAAQMTDELGTIAAFNIRKNFAQKFSVTFREQLNTKDNVTQLDVFIARLTFSYKPVKWLTLGVGYDNISNFMDASKKGDLNVDSYIKNSHRALAQATGLLNAGLFGFSLRERYVYSYCAGRSVPASTVDGKYESWYLEPGSSHTLRSKLLVNCRIPESKWSPYISPEFFNSLNSGAGFNLTQFRLYVGTNFKLSSISSFKFYYCLQSKYTSGENHHLICVDYLITL